MFELMKNILGELTKMLPTETAYAHCDIPCGIYDPHAAQVAAHTIIRMTKLIGDAKEEEGEEGRKEFIHGMTRYVTVKEEHAEILKREVAVIWGDYFKEEHLKDFPNLHETVWKILKLASKTKQGIDLKSAEELLAKVQEFSEIFWKSKGRETMRVASGYPTGGEMVSPK